MTRQEAIEEHQGLLMLGGIGDEVIEATVFFDGVKAGCLEFTLTEWDKLVAACNHTDGYWATSRDQFDEDSGVDL
jgi:hypothetical protein